MASVKRHHSFQDGGSNHGSSHGSSEDEMGYFNQRNMLYSPRLTQMMNATPSAEHTKISNSSDRVSNKGGALTNYNNNNLDDYYDQGSLADSDEYFRNSFENLTITQGKSNHQNADDASDSAARRPHSVNIARSVSDVSRYNRLGMYTPKHIAGGDNYILKARPNSVANTPLNRSRTPNSATPVIRDGVGNSGVARLINSKREKAAKDTSGSQYAKTTTHMRAVPHFTAYKDFGERNKQIFPGKQVFNIRELTVRSPRKDLGVPDEAGHLPGHSKYCPPKNVQHTDYREESEDSSFEMSPEEEFNMENEGPETIPQREGIAQYNTGPGSVKRNNWVSPAYNMRPATDNEGGVMQTTESGYQEMKSPMRNEQESPRHHSGVPSLQQKYEERMARFLKSPVPEQVYLNEHGKFVKSPPPTPVQQQQQQRVAIPADTESDQFTNDSGRYTKSPTSTTGYSVNSMDTITSSMYARSPTPRGTDFHDDLDDGDGFNQEKQTGYFGNESSVFDSGISSLQNQNVEYGHEKKVVGYQSSDNVAHTGYSNNASGMAIAPHFGEAFGGRNVNISVASDNKGYEREYGRDNVQNSMEIPSSSVSTTSGSSYSNVQSSSNVSSNSENVDSSPRNSSNNVHNHYSMVNNSADEFKVNVANVGHPYRSLDKSHQDYSNNSNSNRYHSNTSSHANNTSGTPHRQRSKTPQTQAQVQNHNR